MVVLAADKEVVVHNTAVPDSHMAEGEAGFATDHVVVEDSRKEVGLEVDSKTCIQDSKGINPLICGIWK